MAQIAYYGYYAFVMFAAGVLLIACVRAALRDMRSASERLVTTSVHCPHRREAAVVTFLERRSASRRPVRKVESCSLLDIGERCSETCARLSVVDGASRSAQLAY